MQLSKLSVKYEIENDSDCVLLSLLYELVDLQNRLISSSRKLFKTQM
jgi:hypothetical protein